MHGLYAALHQSNEWLKGIGLENKDVVFGFLFGVLAYFAQAIARGQAEARQRRDQLFSVLTQLLDLKSQIAIVRAEAVNTGESVTYAPRLRALAEQMTRSAGRALELSDGGVSLKNADDAALVAEGFGITDHPEADRLWQAALKLAKDPVRHFGIHEAYMMQLYDRYHLAEAAQSFEVFRAALSANHAAPDHLGRAFYAQAIREYSVGLRTEGREHLNSAWTAYAKSDNQVLKNRRFTEVNAALTQLGEPPLAAA